MMNQPPANTAGNVPSPANYRELYDSKPDVLSGSYAGYLLPFGPESNSQPATLRDATVGATSDIPKVFACMRMVAGSPRIVFLHRLTKYAPSLGGATQWDSERFAFLGDLHAGDQAILVNLPDTPFGRTVQVYAPEAEHMAEAWENSAGADALGPFDDQTANATQLRARFLVPIPQKYVGICLHRTFTPRDFWTEVIGQLRLDQMHIDCAILVNWARVACVYGTPVGNQANCPLSAVDPLASPLADGDLLNRVRKWKLEDLPALGRTTTTLDNQFLQQNATLATILQQQTSDAAHARVSAQAPKTFREKYPEAAGRVMMIAEAQTDADLAPLWGRLANTSKAERSGLLSHALRARANERDSFKEAPVVTPELTEAVWSFQYGADDVDDIVAGLSIFLLSTGSPDQETSARQRTQIFTLMQAGTASTSLDVYQTLVDGAPKMSKTLLEIESAYKGFSTLLDVLWTPEHRLSVHFREFVWNFLAVRKDIEGSFRDASAMQGILPLFTRHTQMCMARYFTAAEIQGATTTLPCLNDLIHKIQFRTWNNLAPLPLRYTSALGPGGLDAASPSREPAALPKTGTPGEGKEKEKDKDKQQVIVYSTHPSSELLSRWKNHPNAKLSKLLGGEDTIPPKTDDSRFELCLSYHLKGVCNIDCRRKPTHRALTETESTRIGEFLTQKGVG
jgi:hypothetical protein